MIDKPKTIKEIIKAAILAEQCPEDTPGIIEDRWLIPYGEGAAAERCEDIAEAVIDILSSSGLKIVPEEPTDKMVFAGLIALVEILEKQAEGCRQRGDHGAYTELLLRSDREPRAVFAAMVAKFHPETWTPEDK